MVVTAYKTIKFVGGRTCLDFVNTVGGRVSNPARKSGRDYADVVLNDKLAGYGDLLTWSQLAGLTAKAESQKLAHLATARPKGATATLQRAVSLRESLYRIFKSVVEQWRPDTKDLEILGRELSSAREHEKLKHSAGVFVWAWDDDPVLLDRILWPVVRSTAELLTSDDLARLRQCGGNKCGWLFLDTSRNHSRQWCDMKDCGNLAKVRRFRERQSGQ
jgi:predicted RNA-binding Zn ribbon-like protein